MNNRMMFRSVVYFYLVTIITVVLLWVGRRGIVICSKGEILVTVSFVAVGVFSIVCLTQGIFHCSISLFIIHWYFILIFFFIVPFLQYLGNLFLYEVELDDLLLGNLLTLLWCLVYLFFYRYTIKKVNEGSRRFPILLQRKIDVHLPKAKLCSLAVISITVGCYLLFLGGLGSFLTRGSYAAFVRHLGGWGPLSLIVTYYLRPLLFCVFVLFAAVLFLSGKAKKPWFLWLCFFLLSLVNVVVNNPLSYARFMSFSMIFGLFVLFSFQRIKPSLVYLYVLFMGLPLSQIAGIFRQEYSGVRENFRFGFNWSFLFLGDFDTYENFIHTISYVANAGIMFGWQLAGALLFFVPRSLWAGKPIGSGTYIAQFLGDKFAIINFNIANPLISEMYLNFHVFGIVGGALFYGVVTGWLDKRYWMLIKVRNLGQSNGERWLTSYQLLYPFLLGLFLLHLRGDFMCSFAYTTGFVLAFGTVVTFLIVKIGQ